MVFKNRIIKSISVENKALEKIIVKKLTQEFNPDILVVIDESYKHAGHNPESLAGGTHFCIKIISKKFKGLTKVQQHRWVYAVLDNEIKGGVHALSLKLSEPTDLDAG